MTARQFSVRVTPRGGRDAVEGVEAGELRVRVRAAPADGAANAALLEVLSGALDVPRSAIGIVGGARGRMKRIVVEGVRVGRLEELWPGLLTSGE